MRRCLAAPVYGAGGELVYAGQDLSIGGALEYFHDVLYICIFVQVRCVQLDQLVRCCTPLLSVRCAKHCTLVVALRPCCCSTSQGRGWAPQGEQQQPAILASRYQ